MDKVRIAIVGCGGMAGAHLNGYAALRRMGIEDFEIVATCDVAEERAHSFAERIEGFQGARPRVYRELGDLLKSEGIDAVDTCPPHHLHHTIAIECLENGVDVIVEKPLAVTVRAGRRMIEAAERNGRILAVAEQVRRWVCSRVIWWAFNSGMLGDPRLIYTHSVSFPRINPLNPVVNSPRPWRADLFTGGGGWVLDVGVHYIDMLHFIFGDVEEVYAVVDNLNGITYSDGPSTVEDTVHAILKFENGIVCNWSWTHGGPGRGFSHSYFYGRLGSIYSPGHYPTRPELRLFDGTAKEPDELQKEFWDSLDDESKERFFPRGITEGVAIELYDFIRAVRTRAKPEVGGWEGLKAQAVCDAFFESSALGVPVKVKDVLECKVESYQGPINERNGIE
jgi:predicted dehydrogenase